MYCSVGFRTLACSKAYFNHVDDKETTFSINLYLDLSDRRQDLDTCFQIHPVLRSFNVMYHTEASKHGTLLMDIIKTGSLFGSWPVCKVTHPVSPSFRVNTGGNICDAAPDSSVEGDSLADIAGTLQVEAAASCCVSQARLTPLYLLTDAWLSYATYHRCLGDVR